MTKMPFEIWTKIIHVSVLYWPNVNHIFFVYFMPNAHISDAAFNNKLFEQSQKNYKYCDPPPLIIYKGHVCVKTTIQGTKTQNCCTANQNKSKKSFFAFLSCTSLKILQKNRLVNGKFSLERTLLAPKCIFDAELLQYFFWWGFELFSFFACKEQNKTHSHWNAMDFFLVCFYCKSLQIL